MEIENIFVIGWQSKVILSIVTLTLDLEPSLLRREKHAKGEVVTSLDSHLNVWKVQGKKINISKCIPIFGGQSWLEIVGCFESLDEDLKD